MFSLFRKRWFQCTVWLTCLAVHVYIYSYTHGFDRMMAGAWILVSVLGFHYAYNLPKGKK